MVVPVQSDRCVCNNVAELPCRISRIRKVLTAAIHEFAEQPDLGHDFPVQLTGGFDGVIENSVRVLLADWLHETRVTDECLGFFARPDPHRSDFVSGGNEVFQQRIMQFEPQAQPCNEQFVENLISVAPWATNVVGKALDR